MNECFELEDALNEMRDLVETRSEGSRDVFVHRSFLSLLVILFSLIPVIIPMSPLCLYYPFLSLSIVLMHLLEIT